MNEYQWGKSLTRRDFLAATGLLGAGMLIAGCSDRSAANGFSTEQASSVESDVPNVVPGSGDIGEFENLSTLNIAASDWAYVADNKGWLKSTFEDNGIHVETVQGTLGNEAQLIARGDLHFANRMLYPYLQYRSEGADLKTVQVSHHPEPKIVSVIVPKDSTVQSFDDLEGKKIASWRAGCPYMALYEIAENKGWKEGEDWTYVNIPSSDSKTALVSGEVDALSAHPLSDIAAILIDGETREIANPAPDSVYINGGGVTVTFTSGDFSKNYPNIVKAYLSLQEQTWTWILKNIDDAASIVESVNRVPTDISKFTWDRRSATFSSNTNLEEIEAETDAMQDWLIRHEDIDSTKRVEVADLFDPQYFA